ncbi:MAG TPA: isopentenyl-diphosphate Delta-isomerase [Puia sp.]|nr:isopentenyl-diphosphate Delta-isomerase [Puia sp.]
MAEEVILVDEYDTPVGVMEKMEAHRKALLHRAFSVYIFNRKGEMLLQRRALTKYHSAGLWTNACCSHPRPGEDTCQAARRRLSEELGFTVALEKIFDFRYKTEFDNGLTEYEFDHVYAGYYDQGVYPNVEEVSEYRWLSPAALEADLEESSSMYTTWFLLSYPLVQEWRIEHGRH